MRRKIIKALKYLVAWGLVPLLLVGGAELALRRSGYGISVRPFQQRHVEDTAVYVYSNSYFHYFANPSSAYKREFTAPQIVIPKEKAPGAFRVFVIGESSAYGFAQPEFGMTRLLEAQLRAAYPGAPIEIYNTALVGMCSNILADIVSEASRLLQPDLFLVYMGNNEFGGRFTMTANAWEQRLSPDLAALAIQAQIRLADLRLVQWLRQGWMTADSVSPPSVGTRPKDQIYGLYQRNLAAICRAAERGGARVALCSVGYNLRDLPRQGDTPPAGLAEPDRSAWMNAYEAGIRLAEAGDHIAAIEAFRPAEQIAADNPPLLQRLAASYEATGDDATARALYDRAVYDAALPPSASARTNAMVKEAAIEFSETVVYVPAEEAISKRSKGGIPGVEFFIDHCHLNFSSTWIVAAEAYAAAQPMLTARFGAPVTSELLSEEACREKLARTLKDDLATLRSSLDNPFPKPEDLLQDQVRQLEARIAAQPPDAEARAIDAALRDGWRPPAVLARAMALPEYQSTPERAMELAAELRAAEPYQWRYIEPYVLLLRSVGRNDEALTLMRSVTEGLLPDIAQAWTSLADIAFAAGDQPLAERAARTALRIAPEYRSAQDTLQRVLAEDMPR